MNKLERLAILEKEIEKLKKECKEEAQYPICCTSKGGHLVIKFTSTNTGTVLESHLNEWEVGKEYNCFSSHLQTNVLTEIAYDEERSLYDKQVVWCWDDNTNAFGRTIRFYDAINRCAFVSRTGERDGYTWDNYEAVESSQIPQFMLDSYDKLED